MTATADLVTAAGRAVAQLFSGMTQSSPLQSKPCGSVIATADLVTAVRWLVAQLSSGMTQSGWATTELAVTPLPSLRLGQRFLYRQVLGREVAQLEGEEC